ncbi:hypothetical protein VAE063_1070053 [Vibrio aestuarianus]|uniref:Uncharacterized protein n=1 Tax=Vibrio aestuarianus TaxID=28171 RepID=A0ABN8TLV2_9VIBR|nr:hypothetical protein VAE063_1070053 [Vibrio aestuarianus]
MFGQFLGQSYDFIENSFRFFGKLAWSKWIIEQPEIDRFQGSWVASMEFWIWFVLNFIGFKSLQLKCLFD